MPGTTYPPGPPTVAAGRITVEQFLRQPTRVQRAVEDLTRQRFIADYLYTGGDAQGGAVIYDRVLAADLYTTRDVQAIEPGSEFPIVDTGETSPLVAAVTKWGGAAIITYEAVRRDARDVLARQLTKLRNTILRKVDTVAVAAITSDPNIPTAPGIAAWNNPTTGDPITDLEVARSVIDDADMGYTADTVLVNPQSRLRLMGRADIRNALPRESTVNNPLLAGNRALQGLLSFNWIVSNRVPVGTAIVAARQVLGSIRDELGLYSRTVDQPDQERWLVMAARVTVPVITDPLAAYRITGI